MRFCQSDGTPLIEDEQPIDPYKTMVASPAEIAAAMPPEAPVSESEPSETKEDDVLQLPVESDPLKTMYASEDEIRQEMAKQSPVGENVMEIPPLAPEPPKFNEPSLSPPTFGDIPPPPAEDVPEEKSPFNSAPPLSPFEMTTPPIPSPFNEPKPVSYDPPAKNRPVFAEPEPPPPSPNPFNQVSAPPAWTPPPAAPEASWQNQPVAQSTPGQPPVAGAGGQNKTLAIVSLVVGVLSLFCCGWFVPGIIAIVLGFLAKSKADNNPNEYGGRGLALGGIITGVFSLILGIIVVVLYFFGFLAGFINSGGF